MVSIMFIASAVLSDYAFSAASLIITFALVTDAYSNAVLPILDRAKPSMSLRYSSILNHP